MSIDPPRVVEIALKMQAGSVLANEVLRLRAQRAAVLDALDSLIVEAADTDLMDVQWLGELIDRHVTALRTALETLGATDAD